jgi:hypothetical protein
VKEARTPSRNLYLYLALACFLGIVLIFLFDGYLGLYDSLKADNGNYLQTVPTEQWQSPDRFGGPFSLSIDQNGYLTFTYGVDNRQFAGYSAPVVVTLTDATGATTEVTRQTLTAGAFGHGEVTWTLRGTDLVPADAAPETAAMYTLSIQRGEVARTITLYVNRNAFIPKVPAPAG